METELIKELNGVLKAFPQFWDGEKLHRSMLIDAINQKEPNLIKALISNDKIKSLYSTDIEGVLLFDFEKLTSLLKYKEFWNDSFTKYRNTVGLTSEGKYLNYNSDVVLDFPFKDCVLEGGMTKEDQGKDEIYYNEVIARDEIDRLFSPKVLTNTKRYTKDGIEENITDFSDEDNLIIKGNNLIALHSLKERYAGKVKLIYIDPPYNTGNDSFKYNDRFNRSTWLTFMKNRLEIAKELLSDDGILAVQCDYNQDAYLKVLLDSIFTENNFIREICIKMSSASGPKMSHIDYSIPKLKESLLLYKKNKFSIIEQPKVKKAKWDPEYSKILKHFSTSNYSQLNDAIQQKDVSKANHILSQVELSTISKEYPDKKTDYEWLSDNAYRIVADKQNTSLDSLLSSLSNHPSSDIAAISSARGGVYLYRTDKDFGTDTRVEIVFAEKNQYENPCDLWLDISTSGGFSYEGGVSFPNAKKPEKLLHRIISMFTRPSDIVLDYHLGSGTTCAVAHKMGRRYIGIEQMDYAENSPWNRLNNVIQGDNTGISKDVEWQGGGSFVYAEMMELNYQFIHKIENANDYETLTAVFEEMKNNAHLNYQADLNKVLKASYEMDGMPRLVGFDELELHEQKKLLIELLDKNQLYVSYSEIKDRTLNVSETDQAFNHSFYEKD